MRFGKNHTSTQTSEPTDIFRADIHHSSHCIFYLHFVVNFSLSATETDQTTDTHVNTTKQLKQIWTGRKIQPDLVLMFLLIHNQVPHVTRNSGNDNSDKIVHICQ